MTTAAQCVHLSSHPVVSWTRLSRMVVRAFFFGNLISSFVRWLLWSLMDISGMPFFLLYIYFLSSPFLPFFLNEFQCYKFACVVNEDDGHWVLLFGSFIQKKKQRHKLCVLLFYFIPSTFVFFLCSLRPIPPASLTSKESPSQWMLTCNKVTAKMCNKFCVCVESSLNCKQSKREKKSYNINKTLHILLGIGNCLNLRYHQLTLCHC